MPEHIRNMSVRGRLLNLSKQRRQPFELLLTRYTIERIAESGLTVDAGAGRFPGWT